jgi:hypothetical protein
MKKLICYVLLLLLTVSLFACAGKGSEFVGKWVNFDNPQQHLEIKSNGNQFVIITNDNTLAAIYKDGYLDAGYVRLTYFKSSDTLLANSIVTGSFEFKRIK